MLTGVWDKLCAVHPQCALTVFRSHSGQTPQSNHMGRGLTSAPFSALRPPRLSACQGRCMLCAEVFAYCRSHEALAVGVPSCKTLIDHSFQLTTRGRV